MSERKTFNHYKSFWEIKKLLSDKQYVEFDKMLCKVEFLELHIDDVEFKDATLSILWVSVKHSVKKCIDGYTTKKRFDYNSLKNNEVDAPCQGSANDLNTMSLLPTQQEEGEEEEKEKEQEKEQEEGPQEFLSFWQKTPFTKVRSITEKRKKKIRERLKNFNCEDLFKELQSQSYLKDNSWFNIDYVIKSDENWEKVLNHTFKFTQKEKKTNEDFNQGLDYGI